MAVCILVARIENTGLPLAGGKVTNSVIVALMRVVLCFFFKVKKARFWVNGSNSISLDSSDAKSLAFPSV